MEDLRGSVDKNNLNSCVYCGHYDPDFNEDDMIVHFAKACPMVRFFIIQ